MAQTSCVGENRASGQAFRWQVCNGETCRTKRKKARGLRKGLFTKKYTGLAASLRRQSGQNNSPRVVIHIAQRC